MSEKIPVVGIGYPPFDNAMARLAELVERANNPEIEPPLQIKREDYCDVIWYSPPVVRWLKLTSVGTSSGSYNAAEVTRTASGGFTVTTNGFSGVVWEANLNPGLLAGVSQFYVEAEYFQATDEHRFQAGTC